MIVTLKGCVRHGVLILSPYVFFPITNKDEVDFLPIKHGFFNCELYIKHGQICAVQILKYLYPKSSECC